MALGTAYMTEKLKRLSGSHITPYEYLGYAKDDLKGTDTRVLVNAVKNIKGALDSQLDVLLEKFGLLDLADKLRWSFPKKVDIVARTNILSPKILNTINRKRVLIEHEHKKPFDRETIEELLDITEMFLEICKGYGHLIRVFIDYENKICVFFDEESGTIKISEETDAMLEFGGIANFYDYFKKIKPKEEIGLDDLDRWLEICGKYLNV